MFEKIKALLIKFGANISDKETELKVEIDKLVKDAGGNIDLSKLDLSKLTTDKDNPLLKTIVEQNQVLIQTNKDLQAALAKEQQERESGIKAATERAKSEHTKKVEAAIEKALKDKKIVESEKDVWKSRLEKDFDEWNSELNAKQVPKQFQGKEASTTKTDTQSKSGNETKVSSPIRTLTEAIREQMESNQSKV